MVFFSSDCFVKKLEMADSTDEDASRFLQSRKVGVLERDVGVGGSVAESVGVLGASQLQDVELNFERYNSWLIMPVKHTYCNSCRLIMQVDIIVIVVVV